MQHAVLMEDISPNPKTVCGRPSSSVKVVLLASELDRMVYRTSAGDVCPVCQELLRARLEKKQKEPTMPKHIDSEAVNAVFLDCLFTNEENPDGRTPADAVIVEGVMHKFDFHRERLESHRQEVHDWLLLLPTEFRKESGGGWSFLNACNEVDGTEWTGLHQRMDELFTLGIGLGLAKWLMPHAMWTMLPGGTPYVQIDVTEPA